MPRTIADLEARKVESFDPVLTQIVTTRVISYEGFKTWETFTPKVAAITPIVKKHVNPRIIDAIANGRLQLDYRGNSKKPMLYAPEDKVRFALRDLVKFYHGNDDRIMVRRLAQSCLQIVAEIVNSDLVAEEVFAATRNVKAA
jgi:hypothetical protein